jgi:hypothetical protein
MKKKLKHEEYIKEKTSQRNLLLPVQKEDYNLDK